MGSKTKRTAEIEPTTNDRAQAFAELVLQEHSTKAAKDLKEALEAGNISKALMIAKDQGEIQGRVKQWLDDRPDVFRECKRRALQKSQCSEKQSASWDKVLMAAKLWNEFDPAEVKRRGKKSIRKEIGEIMQRRLDLPEPIPEATVRDYLESWKAGSINRNKLFDLLRGRKKSVEG